MLAFAAVLALAIPVQAATIQVFEDKAAFLAATGAASATGPLPDLGVVIDANNPGGSATVGSIVFSLAPGGDSLAIGALNTPAAPDWYGLLPGNDIALGFENLRVNTADDIPVFSLGFEMAEPSAATMPVSGVTPVDSTYKVTLFLVEDQVAQFVFNVPDDVVAFVGVWSDTAFDRAEIIDTTRNDDDEYFGEFYTGTAAAPARTFTLFADLSTAIPEGAGTFTSFAALSASAGHTAFLGLGVGGQKGIYLASALTKVIAVWATRLTAKRSQISASAGLTASRSPSPPPSRTARRACSPQAQRSTTSPASSRLSITRLCSMWRGQGRLYLSSSA